MAYSIQWWVARSLAAGMLIASTAVAAPQALASHSRTAAHDDAYGDMGYYSDYGGGYDASSSFTYDAGGTCYEVTCDGGFSDPATNYLYDSSEASLSASTDAADAFDAYIQESLPGAGVSAIGPRSTGPSAFKALGTFLNNLTAMPEGSIRAAIAASRAQVQEPTPASSRLDAALSQPANQAVAGPAMLHAAGRAPFSFAGAGSGISVFVDSQRTYKINYPSNWTMVNHDQVVRGAYVDARLIASDANAGVVGQSLSLSQGTSLNLGDPAVQNYIASSIQFAQFGAQATAQPDLQAYTIPSGDQVLVGRVPFQWVDTSLAPSQFTDVSEGMQGGLMFVALHNNNRLYLVTGTIADMASDSAIDDAKQLSAIFSSLDLIHVYTPTGKPNAIVDSSRTYRLSFPGSSWNYTKAMAKGDTALVSTDRSSAVVAISAAAPQGMGQISSSYMHQVVGALRSTLGKVTTAPVFHKLVSKGSVRYAATLPFRRADGKTGKAMIVATVHKSKVCAVVGIVINHDAQGLRQQAQQASYIVSSLHLM
jgi:hypothetical protein